MKPNNGSGYKRKSMAIFMVFLLIQHCLAKPNLYQHPELSSSQQHTHSKTRELKLQQEEARDLVDSAFTIGKLVLPLMIRFMSSSSGSPSTPSNDIEKIGNAEISSNSDPFSWANLLSIGMKLFLAFVSSTDTGGLDKSDTFPTQAIVGTLISALTGSKNPQEVSTMAKQATEVLSLAQALFEAVLTSFSLQ